MRFQDLSIPQCGYWLEKQDVLFMLDLGKRNVPFVNSKLYNGRKRGSNMFTLHALLHRMHPDDRHDFIRMIGTNSDIPEASFFRLFDNAGTTLWFQLRAIHTGNRHDRYLLAVLTSNELEEVPVMHNS